MLTRVDMVERTKAKLAFDWLCKEAHQTMVQNGFHEDAVYSNNQPAILWIAKMGLVGTEVAEAIEEIRDGRDLAHVRYLESGKPEGFPAELADIVLRVADICGRLNIDLGEAVIAKMDYNRTRPRKHNKEA